MEAQGATIEEFLQLYDLYGHARFEADHSEHCVSGRCINPDHLQWLEPPEHGKKTGAMQRKLTAQRPRSENGQWIRSEI